MKRPLLSTLAGLLTWIVVATIINRVLRLTLPGYNAAELTHDYTLAMKWARLVMALATSVASGYVTGWIFRHSRWPPYLLGGVLLALFLPLHISIWSSFPVWYHLTFLLTILPAVLLGARLGSDATC